MGNIDVIDPIPSDLKDLGIRRIDVDKAGGSVWYVWVGGLDHTFPEIRRTEQGDYRFIANYDEESSRVIWPKNRERRS